MSTVDKSNYALLSEKEWATYYPKGKGKDFPVHQLLVNEKNEVINEKIEEFVKNNPQALVSVDKTPMEFTPLHIAVIKKPISVVKKLLDVLKERGLLQKNINVKDACGFAALHHAAPNPEMVKLLLSYGADSSIKTNFEGTFQDLQHMLTENLDARELKGIISSAEHVFLKEESGTKTKVQTLMEKGTLKSKTGIHHYRDILYVPPQAWKKFWLLPNESVAKIKPFVAEELPSNSIFTKYINEGHTAKIIIGLSSGLKGITEKAMAIFAGQNIPFLSPLGLYSGNLDDSDDTSAYHSVNRDAKFDCNFVSRMNWDWPNVTSTSHIYNGDKIKFYFVCDPNGISQGDEITCTYGMTYNKSGYFNLMVIRKEKQMLAFFEKGLDSILQQIFNLRIGKDELKNLKTSILIDYLKFPLETPLALLLLHLSGKVKAQEWFLELDLFEKNRNAPLENKEFKERIFQVIFSFLEETSEESYNQLKTMLNLINLLDFALKEKPGLKKDVYLWIKKQCNHLPVASILHGMNNILQKLKQTPNLIWSNYEPELKALLKDYDAESDMCNPVNPAFIAIQNTLASVNKADVEELLKSFQAMK